MAKRDSQNERMLFTGFDSLGKQRRRPALSDNTHVTPILTMSRLASTLEFDFEDDAGEENIPHKHSYAKLLASAETTTQEEDLADLPAGPYKTQPPKPSKIIKTPAERWSWIADGRSHTAEQEDSEISLANEAGSRPASRRDPNTGVTDSSVLTGTTDGAATLPGWEQTGEFAPAAEALHRPYDEDGTLPDDDILSHLDIDQTAKKQWQNPQHTPNYGGIERVEDWYSPPDPENDPAGRVVEKVTGWYETPEAEYIPGDVLPDNGARRPMAAPTQGIPSSNTHPGISPKDMPKNKEAKNSFVDGLDLSDLFDLVDQTDEKKKKNAFSSSRLQSSPFESFESPDAASTPTVELPAVDVDLPATDKSSANKSERTHATGIFSEIDIDSLWEEKFATRMDSKEETKDSRQEKASKQTVQEPEAEQPASDGLRPKGVMPSDTVIIDQDILEARARQVSDTNDVSKSSPSQDDDFSDFLDQLISDADEANSVAEALAGSTPEDSGDPFNLDDLIAEADSQTKAGSHSIEAPTVGSDMIIDPADLQNQDIEETPKESKKSSRRTKTPDNADAFDEFPPEEDTSHITAPTVSDNDLFGLPAGYEPPPAPEEENEEKEESTDPDDDSPWDPDFGTQKIDAQTAEEPTEENTAGDGNPESETNSEEAAVAVDPNDVFANMDAMDFSDDGLDDEMKAMLAEDAEADEGGNGETEGEATPADAGSIPDQGPPSGVKGKMLYFARKGISKVIPASIAGKITSMIAWKENWWLYYDLLAAVITSASLAIILSYYIWYNNN